MEQKALKESPAGQIVQRPEAEDEIDLVELFYLLWGHAWQIALCLLVGAGIAFGVTKFLITPKYEATSSIYVVSASNNSVVNLSDLQIGAQLTADYQELILSRPLLEDVIENLELTNAEGEPMSTNALKNMIAISNTADTRILKVTVTSSDPQESADIANELIDQACIYLPQIMADGRAQPGGRSHPAYPEVQPQHRAERADRRLAGGLPGLRRAGCALPDERYLCDPGRRGQISGRAAPGSHSRG